MAKILTNIGQLIPQGSGNVVVDPSTFYIEEKPKYTQTYLATHNGELRLPFMYRSFISFSFGGRLIEDFGIIAITPDDRMKKDLYSDFEDTVLEYEVLDGQFYWSTHHKPLQLSYTLSTDYMTQRQLDDFKTWFAPGKIRELILALHPNRAIMARVSAAPSMSMLPFKGEETKTIGGVDYKIPTTVYKGDIRLDFISTESFWYSICNLLGLRYKITLEHGLQVNAELDDGSPIDTNTQYYEYRWYDVNNNLVGVLLDQDALKIILLDNIPCANMVEIYDNLFLGGDLVILSNEPGVESSSAKVGQHTLRIFLVETGRQIALINEFVSPTPVDDYDMDKLSFQLNNDTMILSYDGQIIANIVYNQFENYSQQQLRVLITLSKNPPYAKTDVSRVGTVYAPALGQIGFISLGGDLASYLYYAGNAPSYPTLKFTLTPILDDTEDAVPYIKYPRNKWCKVLNLPDYNSITILGTKKQQFRFSLPSAWAGYNQALYWFDKLIKEEANTVDSKIYIRDYVNHWAARQWALEILLDIEAGAVSSLSSQINETEDIEELQTLEQQEEEQEESFDIYTGTFSFDCKTGVSTGIIAYNTHLRNISSNTQQITLGNTRTIDEYKNYIYSKMKEFLYNTSQQTQLANQHEENVGDMIRSNYLFLLETNYPNDEGMIVPWSALSEKTKRYTHKITSDYPVVDGEAKLTNFSIEYKNMYR